MQFKVSTAILLAVSVLLLAFTQKPGQVFTKNQQVAQQTPKPVSNSKIAVSEAQFGIVEVNPINFNVSFQPTDKVPLKQGTAYGWRIQLKDYQGSVTWREVFRLPKAAQTWVGPQSGEFTVSADKTQATTSREVYTQDGVISNTWTVIPGDPTGKHIMEVYIDDRRVASIEFNVVATN
jgi:hypothetical protein